MNKKINIAEEKKKELIFKKEINAEFFIIVFGFILILFNLILLIFSYSQLFFMFDNLGIKGYLLILIKFFLSSNFFFFVVFAFSLFYLKRKISSLFFVISIYSILQIIFSLEYFFDFSFFEKVFITVNLIYFLTSVIYLAYKKTRGKNVK